MLDVDVDVSGCDLAEMIDDYWMLDVLWMCFVDVV